MAYVGFASLPNQVHRKSVKKGFEFTLMVAGKCISGICKRTIRLYICGGEKMFLVVWSRIFF